MLFDISNNNKESSGEIGGYFGLELPNYGDPFPHSHKFQSARAALRSVLECASIKRIFLPVFICDSVIQAARDSGTVTDNYLLDDMLYPKNLPDVISDNSAFLYVNYFGLCQKNVDRLLNEVPNKHLIIDNSQAFFSPPSNALATIYSIRKFFGVPDGGLLVTSGLEIKEPENEDTDSIERMGHLLLRMAYSAREGYPDYVKSENTLKNTKPLRMSRLTKRILASIDMEKVKRQRRVNFLKLSERLDKYNNHNWVLGKGSVPLCYPLVFDWDHNFLIKKLLNNNIFIPTYWPEAKKRAIRNSIEYRLTHYCMAVPCDQRYSTVHMSDLSENIVSALDLF